MNLIVLMKHQLVFDALSEELIKITIFRTPFSQRAHVDTSFTRSIVRGINLDPLKITNIKVTKKKDNQHIITFNSDKDRYKCIWDFAERKFLSRSVNY